MSWTLSLRGRRSRNKVSVGEPAEGSFVFAIGVCVLCRACIWCLCAKYLPWGSLLVMHVVSFDCIGCSFIQWYVLFANTNHEHQQWLFWLKWRLRMQQNAICIVTCRSPWTNWLLNALCNFGICLKWGLAHAFVNATPTFVFVRALCVSMLLCVDIWYGFAIVWKSSMVCNGQCYCLYVCCEFELANLLNLSI